MELISKDISFRVDIPTVLHQLSIREVIQSLLIPSMLTMLSITMEVTINNEE